MDSERSMESDRLAGWSTQCDWVGLSLLLSALTWSIKIQMPILRFAARSGFFFDELLHRALQNAIRHISPSIMRSAGVLYREPEAARFLSAVQKLKRQLIRKERQTQQAKQRVRLILRKLRAD